MFADRRDAGRRLAEALRAYEGRPDAVVVAIPRGGVAVGRALADSLRLPLDVIFTKKIGHPDNPEFAIGVVNLNSESVDPSVIEAFGVPRAYVAREIERIRALLRAKYRRYREGRPPIPLRGKAVLLTDDGIATGDTMTAAVRIARRESAGRVVVAVPVGPPAVVRGIRDLADEVVCLREPTDFYAISQFYDHFEPVEDAEAIRMLGGDGAGAEHRAGTTGSAKC